MQKDISGVIKRGFQDFNTLVARSNDRQVGADDDVKTAWEYMKRVATNPYVHFAPKYTEDDWNNRIIALAIGTDIDINAETIRWFVRTPAMIVCENTKPAFQNQLKLYELYRSFCESVLKYEYGYGQIVDFVSPYDNILQIAQSVHSRVAWLQLRDKFASVLKKREY